MEKGYVVSMCELRVHAEIL